MHDPHGIAWTRGAPPITAHLYAAVDIAGKDMAAESIARKADDKGDGTGTKGRRASGFRVPAGDKGGVLTFVDGCGNTEAWTLAAGEGDSVEIASVTSWTGDNIRIYW